MRGDPAQVKTLTPADDGGQNLVAFRRREDEFDVGRWLLQRFQERVERCVGEHVHFVEDKDLEATVRGGELDLVEHVVDVFDFVV